MVKKQRAATKRATGKKRTGAGFEDLTVGQVLNKRVATARPDTKADQVAALIVKGTGTVPVVDGAKRLVGVVSEHDLLLALDEGQAWAVLRAKDIMSGNPYSARPEHNLPTLVHVLTESDLMSVPVADERNRFVGVVSRRDVVKAALKAGAAKRGSRP
ncbi:MAG: hypothetical protein NBKEAIPA_03301 [Nitrospirae bacterium]|nr:MAG: inosine 5'-monophosphate dehydrogenase [Nitrospira sp. OLB3]MBV6471369.1 hypothetical protein [Nitrospirota bacterium]MCE7966538.1 CBS domain-containing protein [Nitrospira sp. NTP2]MCK6492246.1 CBS domain-containing protein [Nitrospira sp.]MEB2339089.1 CBS domain-containing protein [Nitrospirales bacterium]